MQDKEWIDLLERSPQQAHRALIDEYGNLVYAIVINKLRSIASREEIEDCVSDIFVEVFRNTNKFSESNGSLKGFISTIAKHTAIDAFRRLSFRMNKTAYIEDDNTELPPAADRPDSETEQKFMKHRLWEIVRSLGEPDSSILTYQYFYDMKVQEISDKLSMYASAVQKRSIRARERIKKILISENFC